jgi:hypothetical protein
MKRPNTNTSIGRACERARHADSAGKKVIPAAALALLLSSFLSISGCVGLTGASKTGSGQQSTQGAATISVVPASISFGSVAVGGTASQSVTISNSGESNLTITQASTTAAGVTITGVKLPLTVEAGKRATFDIVFSPKKAGAISGNVSVMSDGSASPTKVALSGTGTTATELLTVSTSMMTFGSIAIGQTSALAATLKNDGNSSVTVSKVSVSGASYSTSGVSEGLILAPGQSATLDIRFDPRTTGSLPGSVTVTSNAANSPDTISLSGTGSQTVSHSVELSWSPSTSTVAGYIVYRSEVSGGPYARLDSSVVGGDSFIDSSVQAGLTYFYVVASVTSSGVESSDSTQVSATIPTT